MQDDTYFLVLQPWFANGNIQVDELGRGMHMEVLSRNHVGTCARVKAVIKNNQGYYRSIRIMHDHRM